MKAHSVLESIHNKTIGVGKNDAGKNACINKA